MNYYSNTVTTLIKELSRLPGVGAKSAQRMAFHIIGMPQENAETLANAILTAKSAVKYCAVCCNMADDDLCDVCKSGKRDKQTIMVVEDPRAMAAYEKTAEFFGTYHVLHGAISPMNGVTPSHLKIKELLARLADGNVKEVILATNPNIEGEATAMYICNLIKPLGVLVTRIAHGVPVGGDLEFVDDVTLSRALEGRREL